MRFPSVFEIISKLSNEKVAARAAYFVDEKLPNKWFSRPLIYSASYHLHCVQKSYAWCRGCGEIVIGDHVDPTIHDYCDYSSPELVAFWECKDSTPVPEPEDWWAQVMNSSAERSDNDQELDPALAKIVAGWESASAHDQLRSTFNDYANPDLYRQSQESVDKTDDYDEEDFSSDEPADADAHPITKES